MANGRITNDNVFDLVNSVRLELKQDIANMGTALAKSHGELEAKFDTLEAGRLTRTEKDIRDIQVNQATAATKLAILGFIAASIVGGAVSLIVKVVAK